MSKPKTISVSISRIIDGAINKGRAIDNTIAQNAKQLMNRCTKHVTTTHILLIILLVVAIGALLCLLCNNKKEFFNQNQSQSCPNDNSSNSNPSIPSDSSKPNDTSKPSNTDLAEPMAQVSNVDQTGQSNEDNTVNEPPLRVGNRAEIILYFASWCGYSRSFLPEWEKFEKHAEMNMPHIRVTKIQCESDNEALCFQKGIEGYPTVVMHLPDGTEIKFERERTSDKLIEFVKDNLKATR